MGGEVTRRLLPPDEWPRLADTELGPTWHLLEPDAARILVVEQDGAIVGCWAFLNVLHAEGVWVHPAHRGGSSVARHLLRGLYEIAATTGAKAVWTGSVSDQIDGLLEGLGAQEVPFKSWVIPMVKGES